jgi:hypothetical protein
MNVSRLKSVSAFVGAGAVAALVIFDVAHGTGAASHSVAGGSGDSATGTQYTSPTVPNMAFDPTDLSTGATVTAAKAAATMATSFASPTLKASPAAGCTNNGQCP